MEIENNEMACKLLEEIHTNYQNGNLKDMVRLIDEYGNSHLDFLVDYHNWLRYEGYEARVGYDYFFNVVVIYNHNRAK